FKCKTTTDCIDEEKRCDGAVDCKDGSDEFNDCKEIPCPGFLFTCDYGACIEMAKKCDGKRDCRDNSDETNCVDSTKVNTVSSNCKSDQFECKSGQCISLDDKCSGTPECDDKSDETKETCLNMYCPGFTFKCDYGACVNGYAKCDGIKDCIDNSDEEDCAPKVVPKPTPSPDLKPLTPNRYAVASYLNVHYMGNGLSWEELQPNPENTFPKNTFLQVSCTTGYKLSSESPYVVCKGTEWSATVMPTCLKKCPSLYSTKATTVRCHDDRGIEVKCDEATDGATATVSCAPYYEPVEKEEHHTLLHARIVEPAAAGLSTRSANICGEKKVSAVPLIVNGKTVERGNYPWVTAIYKRNSDGFGNVCGGSILTQRVILTAAHCVTNNQGVNLAEDNIRIAVGKYYNKYNDIRDTEAQYSEIEKIITPSFYKADSQRYSSDIALLITKTELLLSKVVQPVCYLDIGSIRLSAGLVGVVTGWGYTNADSQSPSDELLEIDVPYKAEQECYAEFPQDWIDKYYTRDKMCAGHYNRSIAVCSGDSGGGLVFKNRDDHRYYVHGIVSVGHNLISSSVATCDIQVSALYTKVADHYEWLDKIVSQYVTVA
ncbi:hypothetical protein NQ318_006512, partial [Aromia moschata]